MSSFEPPNPPGPPQGPELKRNEAAVTEELLPRRKPVPSRLPKMQQEPSKGLRSPLGLFKAPSLIVVLLYTLGAGGVFVWIAIRLALEKASWTSSSMIGTGGNFTQPQAKVVDFIYSTIIAPLIVALFNFCVFRVARRCVINERTGRGETVSLGTLVEVGGTDWGTYSPNKFIALLKTGQWRTMLLAIITVMCAIASSALTNVVAYQSTDARHGAGATLGYLYAPPSGVNADGTGGGGLIMPQLYGSTSARFTSEWFAALTELSYSTADDLDLLDNGAYIAANVTDASLTALPLSVIDLYEVPAYKLTYECKPRPISIPGLINQGAINRALSIGVSTANPLNETQSYLYQGLINNGASTILSADSGVYNFLAFGVGDLKSIFFGNIGTFNQSNYTTVSQLGSMRHLAFNNTLLPPAGQTSLGTKIVLSMWGMACNFYQQTGTVSLHRSLNSSSWIRGNDAKFGSDKELLTLILKDLQLIPPYSSPVSASRFPGLGAALAASTNITAGALAITQQNPVDYEDFQSYVRNTLYAEAKARRIAYEVAETNSSAVTTTTYTIRANTSQTRYQMTFVPWILAIGLLALFNAGVMILRLAVADGFTKSRMVTPLRIVVDAGAGLSREQLELAENLAKEKEVEAFGARTRVRYVREDDDGMGYRGMVRLRATEG